MFNFREPRFNRFWFSSYDRKINNLVSSSCTNYTIDLDNRENILSSDFENDILKYVFAVDDFLEVYFKHHGNKKWK